MQPLKRFQFVIKVHAIACAAELRFSHNALAPLLWAGDYDARGRSTIGAPFQLHGLEARIPADHPLPAIQHLSHKSIGLAAAPESG